MKKKILLILAVAVLAAGVCACTTSRKSQNTLPELTIGGTTYSPYFYQNIDGEYAGIDVEVAREACSRIGYKPVFKEIPIEDRFRKLNEGAVDCLWSCLTMDVRKNEYKWAGPYLYTQRVVVVRSDSDIQGIEDLKDTRVAVQTGSTSEKIILDHDNPDFPEIKQLTSFRKLGEVFTALRKGYVDAIVGHEGSLKVYTDEYPDEYRYLNMSLRSEALGVAFTKNTESEVPDQLDQVFEEMREDGTLKKIVEEFGLDVEKNIYGGSADE